MPSPFPGMDPYLEGELWSNFHTQFAVEIARQLNPLLAPRYVAVTENYQNVVGPEEIAFAEADVLTPDVSVSQVSTRPRPTSTGTSLLPPPLRLETVISIPVRHVWIKILDMRHRTLVTPVEFLSPTNKKGKGRVLYLRKRRRLLLSSTHLLEIDLQRRGKRVPMADPLPSASYFLFLNRAGKRPETEVWPIELDQPLPRVPVPLLAGDDDVELDVQEAFRATYDLATWES